MNHEARGWELRGAHASRVPVAAFRRDELPSASFCGIVNVFPAMCVHGSSRWRDAIAGTRDACAPRSSRPQFLP